MTKANNDLTVLLTTKGRDLHTLRWLWHANRTNLPFHVYIADGEPKQEVIDLLANKANFPNISYQHELYEDYDFSAYYKKIENALLRINTEFVMLSDNDDFLLPSGVQKSITFLKEHIDHVGALGRIGFFQLEGAKKNSDSQLVGASTFSFPASGGYAPRSIDQDRPAVRVISGLTPYTVTYYSVFRTRRMRIVASECSRINFKSLNNVELFLHLRMLSLGSVHINETTSSYIRQMGTSQGTGVDDIFRQLLNGSHAYDINQLIERISKEAAESDAERDKIADQLFEIFRLRLIGRLSVEFPFMPRLLRHIPLLGSRYLYWLVGSMVRMILHALGNKRHERKQLFCLARASERDLDEIRSTLGDPNLRMFLIKYAELEKHETTPAC